MKLSKNLAKIAGRHDKKSFYSLEDAVDLVQEFKFVKFDESIDLAIKGISNNLGAYVLSDTYFSLDSYLISGSPVAGAELSPAAYEISRNLFQNKNHSGNRL